MAAFLIKLLCFLSLIWLVSPAKTTTSTSTTRKTKRRHQTDRNTIGMYDRMGREEKLKIVLLSEDLLRESVLRIRQIIDIRTEHEMFTSFSVGAIIGRMREKYRFMVEAYRASFDAFRDRTIIRPPGIIGWIPIFLFVNLELMRTLELEIDKLVDIIIDEAEEDFDKDAEMAGGAEDEFLVKEKMMKRNNTRTREGDENRGSQDEAGYGSQGIKRRRLRSQEEIMKEERQKSLIRQQFLMKKIGLPLNSTTTMKRFQRRWPVEETWALDKYNQFY